MLSVAHSIQMSLTLSLCSDPLDSLSELNRLLQVKATLRRVTTANANDSSTTSKLDAK